MSTKNTLSDYTQNTRIFPGITKIISTSKTASANATTTLENISGKGLILGGYIFSPVGTDESNGSIRITIDNTELLGSGWKGLDQKGITPPAHSLLRVTKYDTVNHIYAMDIYTPITFESSFLLQYKETNSNTITISYNLFYTLFE